MSAPAGLSRLRVPRDSRSFQHTEGLLHTCRSRQEGLIGQACYPRSTFYLLSDGLSIQHRRITKPDFRPCSTYRSRSQAPFYLCARSPIADRAEGTFELLRYALGGDRPSQTAQIALSTARLHGIGVRTQAQQGWCFSVDSPSSGDDGSQSPSYSTHAGPKPNTKLQ